MAKRRRTPKETEDLSRTNQLKVMLSDSEKEILTNAAKVQGLTASDIIRQLIRNVLAARV